ncbi:MAG: hypothetical protein ACOVML_04020 [Burkholderiaceae bacterium]|jgi:hypothetical protein
MTTLNTAQNLQRLLEFLDQTLVLRYAEQLSDLLETAQNGVTIYHFHDGSAALASYHEFKAVEYEEVQMKA